MSPRIKVETSVPAGTEVGLARSLAKLKAAEALGIHIVEEALIPSNATMWIPDPENGDALKEVLSPNDHTVDRVLTTWWKMIIPET